MVYKSLGSCSTLKDLKLEIKDVMIHAMTVTLELDSNVNGQVAVQPNLVRHSSRAP